MRNRAYLLILIGALPSLLAIPFLTNYKPEEGWWWNLMHITVAFGSAVAIPYRFILAFSVFLIFVGIYQLDLSRR